MSGSKAVTLEGYILPDKGHTETGSGDDGSGADSEEDAAPMPEFFDVNEVHRSPATPRREVQFQTFDGRVVRVMGRFFLREPWWHITCTVQRHKNKQILKGSAGYKLRTDLDQEGWRSIVSLFLVACNVPELWVTWFFKRFPKECYVAIDNLMKVLSEFGEDDDDFVLAKSIITVVSKSVAARRVWASCFYPSVMKYLPVLLPRQFLNLLDGSKKVPMPLAADAADAKVDNGDRQLAKLEEIIKTDVWKLGFSKVMLDELKMVRCEARLEAFKECHLLQKMPRLQHDALWVYNELKKYCTSTGSTYMEQDALCNALRKLASISDTQVWESLPFLQDLHVVVCDQKKVVLKYLHDCEAGIADCLCHLVNAKRWEIPVNVRDVLYADAEERQRVKMQKEKQAKAAPVLAGKHGNDVGNDVHTEIHVAIDPDSIPEPDNSEAECHKCLVPEPSQESNEAHHAVINPGMEDSTLPPVEVDRCQLRAGEMICANPVTVISGIGGCGKTTLVSLVFKAAVGQKCPIVEEATDLEMQEDKLCKENILLTAPTGRAACVLTKKTGFKAHTLHQVIWNFYMTKPDENGRKQWKFESTRALVVDEGSLVSVQLLHDVLSLLIKHAKLQKFIILGDVRQLPSIQPGNALYDLFHSLKVVNCTMELMNNHRSESDLIVENARLIAKPGMRSLKFDAVVDLHGSFNIPENKKFIHIRLPDKKRDDDLQTAVKLLIQSAPGLDKDLTSQFITFKRVDVALINELCCTHYNKHTTKNHRRKWLFQPGDKVCVTKNAYIHLEGEVPKKADGEECVIKVIKVETQERMRLCNGEIFFIRQDKTEKDERGQIKQRLLTLDNGLGQTITAEYRELLRDCKLRHAWARTIHTFQGAENETIVFVLEGSWPQTWKHVYTAVTRGQKRVYVVSTDKALESTLKRQERPRLTRLQGLVKEKVVQLLQSPLHQHCGSPKFTPQSSKVHAPKFTPLKSSPGDRTPWTTSRSQAASGSTWLTPKRLFEREGAEEAPDGSPMKDVKQGTASNSAAAGAAAGAAKTERPPKQPKYDWLHQAQ